MIADKKKEVLRTVVNDYGPVVEELFVKFFGVKDPSEIPKYNELADLIKNKSFYWLNELVTGRFKDKVSWGSYKVMLDSAKNPEDTDLVGLGESIYYRYLAENDPEMYRIPKQCSLHYEWSNHLDEFIYKHFGNKSKRVCKRR